MNKLAWGIVSLHINKLLAASSFQYPIYVMALKTMLRHANKVSDCLKKINVNKWISDASKHIYINRSY